MSVIGAESALSSIARVMRLGSGLEGPEDRGVGGGPEDRGVGDRGGS